MNISTLSIFLLGIIGCADNVYYDAQFDPRFGNQRVSNLGTTEYSISPSAAAVPMGDFKGKFNDLKLIIDFNNGFSSHINIDLKKFLIKDKEGNITDLLPNSITSGASSKFNNSGEPIGRQSFTSQALPDLPQGKYEIEISGLACEATNCFEFNDSTDVNLVFYKVRDWHT